MGTQPVGAGVGAVVALKPAERAKSRLGSLADPLRRRLAWCMAVDTLAALSEAVDRLLVVSDQPALESRLRRLGLPVVVIADPAAPGMNAALAAGDEWLREQGCAVVLASVGDLPALRPDSVRRVLAAAGPHPRCYLADHTGTGTTMLLARGVALQPRFQGPSARAHAESGAVALSTADTGDVPDARHDVDTEADLAAAAPLGLGPATSALLDPDTAKLGRYVTVTATAEPGEGRAITEQGYRVDLPAASLQDALRTVRAGQRLHAVTSGTRVLAAWL
jgi:2-phospho-L-lactate guanylyltransferase